MMATATKSKWFITEFTRLVNETSKLNNENYKSIHYNTLDKWFKELENYHIHYVQREMNHKVYDETDLKIALLIIEKRHDDWSLSMIREYIQCLDYLRPFPKNNDNKEGYSQEKTSSVDPVIIKMYIDEVIPKALENMIPKIQTISLDIFRNISGKTIDELKEIIVDSIENYSKDLKYNVEQYVMAAYTTSKHILVKDVLNAFIALEDEAIAEWNSQSRMKSRIFYQEDLLKRDQFIRHYMLKHVNNGSVQFNNEPIK